MATQDKNSQQRPTDQRSQNMGNKMPSDGQKQNFNADRAGSDRSTSTDRSSSKTSSRSVDRDNDLDQDDSNI